MHRHADDADGPHDGRDPACPLSGVAALAGLSVTTVDPIVAEATEEAWETLALLKLIALGRNDVAGDRVVTAREAIEALRSSLCDVILRASGGRVGLVDADHPDHHS